MLCLCIFRAKGYALCQETKLYYLQSRYYNPEVGRFLNADSFASTGQGILGNNMFAYCQNNPVIYKDTTGNAIETVWDVISLGISIAEVAANPADFWAWAGLAGDIADVLVPCAGGLGEIIRSLKTAGKAVDALDTANDIKKGWKLGESVTNLTKAGNIPSWSTIRSRYWKNKALCSATDYSSSNISRMKKGLAPLVEYGGKMYPMELHHPYGRVGQNIFIFMESTPWDHAAVDVFRYFVG